MSEGRESGPSRVGDVLDRFLEERGLDEKVERAGIVEEWGERVGERIADVTEPKRVSGTTLIVAVRSSAWMMELDMLKPKILERLNAGRRRGRIEKLVFVLAERDGEAEGNTERGR